MRAALSTVVFLVTALAATAKPLQPLHESSEVVVNGLGFVARVQAVWKMSATKTPLTIQLVLINHTAKPIQFALFETTWVKIGESADAFFRMGFSRTWTNWPRPFVIGPGRRAVLDEGQAFLVNVPPQEFIMTDATNSQFQSRALIPGSYKLGFDICYPSDDRVPLGRNYQRLVPDVAVWSGQAATATAAFRIVTQN